MQTYSIPHPLAQRPKRGSALVIVLVGLTVAASLAASAYVVHFSEKSEAASLFDDIRAVELAEAGVAEAALAVAASIDLGLVVPAGVGSAAAPITQRGGSYWATIADNGDRTYTVVSSARTGLHRRTLEAVLAEVPGSIYDHALFAGNSSGDGGYELEIGGTGTQADQVLGNIYSGGDVLVSGDAYVAGSVTAGGSISGLAGTSGETLPIPDLSAMDYAVNNDVDVAAEFSAATWVSDGFSSAWQLPESSAAHIFRKNPGDRTAETSTTTKDDYFLEDPYEMSSTYVTANGGKGRDITLSGVMGKPGPSGNDLVYYVDGNLWIHNVQMYGFRFKNTDPDGSRLTIVVHGNIFISDDIDLYDSGLDGVALIAKKDPAEPDSGNVYFGDKLFGTLAHMQAFIYAEDTFYDRNLDASGSTIMVLDGNMTAGNQVEIERDYTDGAGNSAHSRLDIDFDDRISTGALVLPGLPGTPGAGTELERTSWRVIANP